MSTRILKTATFAVLAAWSVLALAQTDNRVGRIAVAEGQVTIAGELGEQTQNALVNWPVTSRNQVTTGRDARTEIRIGSTAIRLDADSALDVTELDNDSLRLHLHYGSASVRVRNPDMLHGFELSTPQGIIRMQETGRVRVDAGRRQDTTMISVFDGSAVVDGGGSRLTVRAGKRAEIGQDDIRTGRAMRDNFDDWAMLRDERAERSRSVRYVHREMTGYEDLDEYGSWRQSSEYGPLWSPSRVPYGWAPYRDGRWTYLQPWGWTWVDNASWGYAPFHYGRWVMVDQHWAWAPGRNISRVVWSPALVGWVGGSNWNLSFTHRSGHRAMPAQGWYPLAPRDAYVPSYRMNHDNLQYVNRHAANTQPDVRRRSGGRPAYAQGDHRRPGLTVVPHEQFNQRGTVAVKGMASGLITAAALKAAPMAVAPPVPAAALAMRDRNNDGRADRRGVDQRAGSLERGAVPAAAGRMSILTPPARSATPAAANAAPMAPSYGSAPVIRRESRFGNEDLRRDPRTRNSDTRLRMERPTSMPTPAPALPPAMDTPPPAAATVISAPSQPLAAPQPNDERLRAEREAARERLRARRESIQRDPDVERDRMVRGMEAYQRREPVIRPMPQVHQQIQQQVQQQPQRMAPAPMAQPQPQPQPMAQPQPQQQRMAPPPMAQPQPQPQQEQREMRRRLIEDKR